MSFAIRLQPAPPLPRTRRARTKVVKCSALSEPSTPIEASIPSSIEGTIYHVLPRQLPYLAPPKHPSDNDTAVLALSLNRQSWLRTRFLRTKRFVLESRLRERVYRGLHGTPAVKGVNAKTKPKVPPAGITTVGKWLLVYGFGLPWRVSQRDLVTFGETALRDVLTDGPLLDQRGTELVHSCGPLLLALARNPAGRVLSSFVVELGDDTRRVCRLDGFHGRCISVCDEFVVVVGWKTGGIGGIGGLMTGLFGNSESAPVVDVNAGSDVLILDKSGNIVVRGNVEGILTNVSAVKDPQGGISIRAKKILGKQVNVTNLEDIKSGNAFSRDGDVNSSLIEFDVRGKEIGDIRNIGIADVEVMDVAKVNDASTEASVYIGYNRETKHVGLWNLQGAHWEAENGETLSGALYNPQHTYISVVVNAESSTKMLFFQSDNITVGPVAEIPLEGLGDIYNSIDGVWTDLDFEWSDENAKIVKSAYELFAEKEWNDIESGFSSLGLR